MVMTTHETGTFAWMFLFDRESTDQSYQLLRDSLDLYLAMYPDNVQHLMLQARLYFHLGIWPEKVPWLV